MYSLALIIFVVSEKKAFEHLSLEGPLQNYVFYVDRKSKMAATAIHRLTLDPRSNVKLSPVVAAIFNFISEQKICRGSSNEHSCTVWL
jgi:hypothetical protein